MVKELPDTEPRYVVYDFEFKSGDGRMTSKMFWIFWCNSFLLAVDAYLLLMMLATSACIKELTTSTCNSILLQDPPFRTPKNASQEKRVIYTQVLFFLFICFIVPPFLRNKIDF